MLFFDKYGKFMDEFISLTALLQMLGLVKGSYNDFDLLCAIFIYRKKLNKIK